MLFELGQIVATSGIAQKSEDPNFAHEVRKCLSKHIKGDWGDLCEEDKNLNEQAIQKGTRILSAYNILNEKIYIITEADRSVTTVLFAREY